MKPTLALALSVSLVAAILAAVWIVDRSSRAAEEKGAAERMARLEEGWVEMQRRKELVERGHEASAARLARLEMLLERLETSAHARPAAEAGSGAGTEALVLEARALEARLEEFAERVDALESRWEGAAAVSGRGSSGAAPGGGPEPPEVRRRIAAEAQGVALDRARSIQERLQALKDLRSRDGRSRAVAQAMLEMLQDPSLAPSTRADIIRNLSGLGFEEMKQPLLSILESDPDRETREETVETLEELYGDPAVHAAVVRVANEDPDPRVRAEALRRLARFDARPGATGGER